MKLNRSPDCFSSFMLCSALLLWHCYLPTEARASRKFLGEVSKAERYGGAVFGFAALSFVQTYDCVYKELGKPASMTATVDRTKLGVTANDKAGGESDDEACLRHLRNCFAHGRFTITVAGTSTTVDLHDQN
jgi:hypothetical protein